MQANTNTNRKDNQSGYITRTIRRDGQEIIIIERKPQPQRIGGFEL